MADSDPDGKRQVLGVVLPSVVLGAIIGAIVASSIMRPATQAPPSFAPSPSPTSAGMTFPPELLPPPETSPSASPPRLFPRPDADLPDTFVAATTEGRLVVASISKGEILRELEADPCRGLTHPSQHTGMIYFLPTESVEDGIARCSRTITAIPKDGGKAREIGEARWTSLSHDGRFLFQDVSDITCDNAGESQRLVVSDLVSRRDLSWTVPTPGLGCLSGPAAWGSDGKFSLANCYEGCSQIKVFDIGRPGSEPTAARGDYMYLYEDSPWIQGRPVHRAGDATISEWVRSPYGAGSFAEDANSSLLVNVPDGPGRAEIVTSVPGTVRDVDYDSSGQHVLFIVLSNQGDIRVGPPENYTLFAWSNGRVITLGTGFTQVAW